ncbi:C-reactive protein 3.3 [Exaiptasia diaphana]|nr:C-reactive protein 3.3 [Exaiptasia diaphana]
MRAIDSVPLNTAENKNYGFEGTQAAGQTIQKGGVILGQDADSYLGGYDSNQALQGTLSMVNMWDKELSSAEIAAIYSSKCSSSHGNVVKWDDLVKKRFGQVRLSCSRSFCIG